MNLPARWITEQPGVAEARCACGSSALAWSIDGVTTTAGVIRSQRHPATGLLWYGPPAAKQGGRRPRTWAPGRDVTTWFRQSNAYPSETVVLPIVVDCPECGQASRVEMLTYDGDTP